MRNHKPEKLKLTKRIFLFVLAMALTNCQDNESPTKQQEQGSIKTVSVNEAKAFLTKSINSHSAKSASSEIDDLEFDKATSEKINGSDQLLTVIPLATNNEVRNDRVLVMKIDDEIRSVIFSMQPDENSARDSFSGKVFIYSLEGDFITGYEAKDGIYIGQYLKEKSNSKTSKNPQDGEGGVLIINYYKKRVNAVNATDFEMIWGSGGSSPSALGDGSGMTWDPSTGGGSGSASTPTVVYPDCASFNFIKMANVPWQEAAVKNIHFDIVIVQSLTPLMTSTETIRLPQAVSFQMPTNTAVGNTNITAGYAASVTAKAIDMAMKETREYYKAVPATELMVTEFFKKALKTTFEFMSPGSRLQINPVNTVPPTEYKSNWFLPSDCK